MSREKEKVEVPSIPLEGALMTGWHTKKEERRILLKGREIPQKNRRTGKRIPLKEKEEQGREYP